MSDKKTAGELAPSRLEPLLPAPPCLPQEPLFASGSQVQKLAKAKTCHQQSQKISKTHCHLSESAGLAVRLNIDEILSSASKAGA